MKFRTIIKRLELDILTF